MSQLRMLIIWAVSVPGLHAMGLARQTVANPSKQLVIFVGFYSDPRNSSSSGFGAHGAA